jgi:hypothetical protein
MSPSPSKARPDVHLAVIRLAMLVGVLIFGGVIWFLRRQGGLAPLDADAAAGARLIAVVWLVGSIGGLVAMLALTSREVTEARRRTLSILAWALGEGAALAGGVVYLMAGDARWYIGGLFVLLASFVLFPARRRE